MIQESEAKDIVSCIEEDGFEFSAMFKFCTTEKLRMKCQGITDSPRSFEHYICAEASLSAGSTLYDAVSSGDFLSPQLNLKFKGRKGRQQMLKNQRVGHVSLRSTATSKVQTSTGVGSERRFPTISAPEIVRHSIREEL